MSPPGEPRHPGLPLGLYGLSVVVGAVAGIGAVVFRGLIAIVHNVFFLGRFSWSYDANAHTAASPWGAWVILVPVIGALVVAFLVQHFAPEAKGHGVPEVMDATYYHGGVIRPVVAAIKALASALSIGTGGSVGREGPIIQIGAAFGSTLADVITMPRWQRITLVAAGAGGGIAATFNTPIGGILFAIELILHEVSVRTLVPVGIATVTATYIGRYFFGLNPSFVISPLQGSDVHIDNPAALLLYAILGIMLGLSSALFIKALYGAEDFFDRHIAGSYYRRHALGMLLVGIGMYISLRSFGHYFIQGVGYATIQDVLSGVAVSLPMMAILFVLKLAATSVTLGSGASGGIFSPALYLGATLGGMYGAIVAAVFPTLGIGIPTFAVAGMVGSVGGITGAAMTAIIMIFEMTRDYAVVVPAMITAVLSYAVRRSLVYDNVYTMKLSRRGHYVPSALQTSTHSRRRVRDYMVTDFVRIPEGSTLQDLSRLVVAKDARVLVVEGADGAVGVIRWSRALNALSAPGGTGPPSGALSELQESNLVRVSAGDLFFDVIARMRREGAELALVTKVDEAGATAVVGVVTPAVLARALEDQVADFAD
jgi:CIC family chloride channel protein